MSSPVATPAATPRVVAGLGTPRAGAAPAQAADGDDDAAATEEPDEDAETPAATDEESPPQDETPETEADGEEETDAPDPTTVVLAGCDEPDPLPERTGRQNRIVADEGLRLRAGPGTSCDEILSLSLDTPVRVVSGIVVSEDDEIEWVKVEVDDEEGWVAVEFLANPPAD